MRGYTMGLARAQGWSAQSCLDLHLRRRTERRKLCTYLPAAGRSLGMGGFIRLLVYRMFVDEVMVACEVSEGPETSTTDYLWYSTPCAGSIYRV